MSATNRGKRLDATGRDLYETPAHTTESLLPVLANTLPPGAHIIEPCAGNGAISRVLSRAGYDVTSGDIHPSPTFEVTPCDARKVPSLRALALDRTRRPTKGRVSAVVTNPPYSQVGEILPRVLEAYPGVPVWMLLRLGWLEPAQCSRHRWLAVPGQWHPACCRRQPEKLHGGQR